MFDQTKIEAFIITHRQKLLVIVPICIGSLLIFFGLLRLPSDQKESVIADLMPSVASTREKIVVEIAGAVKSPGVYELDLGSRVSDLVHRAQGFSQKVDALYVAQNIRLAAEVSDGEKVYIKFLGEEIVSASKSDSSQTNDGDISINTATETELQSLDGIGEKRASEIVLQRPYQSLDELLEKEVLTATIYEKIKGSLKL